MDSVTEDTDFEVTADMLIHNDIDDERTLEEEEKMEQEEEVEGELSELEKESNMPLENLLAKYGYKQLQSPAISSSEGGEEEELTETINKASPPQPNEVGVVLSMQPPELIHVPPELPTPDIPEILLPSELGTSVTGLSDQLSSNKSGSGQSGRRSPWYRPGADPEALARLRPVPERRSIRMGMQSSDTVVDSTFKLWLVNDMGEGDEDGDSYSDEDCISSDWKQEIKVGSDYQALVPNCPSLLPSSGSHAQLLWSPNYISDTALENYLSSINTLLHTQEGLPGGSLQRDNEHALYILTLCNYDVTKALDEFSKAVFTPQGMAPWTEEECRKFETGLRALGKDFYSLQKQIPSRSVREIIEFYYLWKKSERYDAFAQQQSKMGKKFMLQPGYISDFMESYLDPPDTEFTDLHYGSTTLSNEVKKDRSQILNDERMRQMQKAISAKSS